MGKKKIVGIFCLILTLQCFVIVMWGMQKVRLNVDEMFTMEGARQSGYGERYWDKAEDFYGKEHTHQEFLDHMTVASDDLLIQQGASEVYDALMHRGFYYSVINLVSTFYPEHIPWTAGIVLNLIVFVVSQFFLYLITREILGDTGALCTVAAYGFSAGAISTVLYVRCYMMLTMYVLMVIYLYLQFMRAEKKRQKMLYIVCFWILAFLSYRTHQFGAILFVIITALFILYMVGSRKKKCLIWLIVGYGLPFLLGSGVIFSKIYSFFSGSVASLFYSIIRNTDMAQVTACFVRALCVVAQHLFVRVRIMLILVVGVILLCVRIVYVRHKEDGRYDKKTELNRPVIIISAVTVMIYYGILVIGTAVSWKYLSPVYPLVILLFMSALFYISRTMEVSFRVRAILAVMGVILTLASYNTRHISEMFAGEEGMRDILEQQYSGVNGIMIHHDVQGDGEVYLYEAAILWPEMSNVLVLQHHMLLEEGLFEYRDDDKILLWLTADFDREESIELFEQRTDYKDIKLILNTDHVWVYECNR